MHNVYDDDIDEFVKKKDENRRENGRFEIDSSFRRCPSCPVPHPQWPRSVQVEPGLVTKYQIQCVVHNAKLVPVHFL